MIQSRQMSCCINSSEWSFLEGPLGMTLKHKTLGFCQICLRRKEGGRHVFSRGKKPLTPLKLSVAREGQGKFRKTPFYVLYDVYSVAQSQGRDEKGCSAMQGCESCVYLIG